MAVAFLHPRVEGLGISLCGLCNSIPPGGVYGSRGENDETELDGCGSLYAAAGRLPVRVEITEEGCEGKAPCETMELTGDRADAFFSLWEQGTELENYTQSRERGELRVYRLVLDTGDTLGYQTPILYDGERYFIEEGKTRLLPREIAEYIPGVEDPNPSSSE